MPKVKEGYFEDKRNAILDVAEKICMEKPLNKVTMKDIVTAAGLSPGAVYATFADIDELLIALVNRLNIEVDFRNEINNILQADKSPEEKIDALVSYMIELVHASVKSYGKIFSELSYIIASIKGNEKREKYKQNVNVTHIYDYIGNALIQLIEENITNGYFKPAVSKESIYVMTYAFIDGLIRDLTFIKCYKFGNPPMGITFEEEDLPKAVADSIIFLLNRERRLGENG